MTVRTRRSQGYLVAGVLALAAGTAPPLAAQGGEKVIRPAEPATTEAGESAHLEPARGMLRTLVGTWRFEVRFAGNFTGAADASGTRVVKPLFDDLRVEWTEELDHSRSKGQGVLGFDPATGRFFSSAIYSAGAAPEVLTGILDAAEPFIAFSPVALTPDADRGQDRMRSCVFMLVDENHFTWAARDRAWRAVFTRQK
ncbi:MAG TPA: DUF1579 family protein [Gemmatimonadales bacterium]|jgi:hypothetical protein|nr:DUF1579 family protein [Gemmatimonadales bacterium]